MENPKAFKCLTCVQFHSNQGRSNDLDEMSETVVALTDAEKVAGSGKGERKSLRCCEERYYGSGSGTEH